LSNRKPARRLLALSVAAIPLVALFGYLLAAWLGNNVSIRFYGRVIDQTGYPCKGVVVRGEIVGGRFLTIPAPFVNNRSTTPVAARTDADGRFSIRGRGRYLMTPLIDSGPFKGVWWAETSFEYAGDRPPERARHHPDPEHPALFRVWTQDIQPDRVVWECIVRLGRSGSAKPVNLLSPTGECAKGEVGDLRVSIDYPDDVRGPADWTLVAETDGGMLETEDATWTAAPDEGYRRRYEYTFHARSQTDMLWQGPTKRFYLRARDGKLVAGVAIEALPVTTLGGAAVRIHCVDNTKGGQDLVPKPPKE
jgi:hypothetical protein